MKALVKSVLLIIAASLWLTGKWLLIRFKEAKRETEEELNIKIGWLELIKTSAITILGIFIFGFCLAVLQN